LMLHFSVQFRAQQKHDRRNPEPCHESDSRSERAIRFIELAEIGCIPGEQN
jgi:hypothetical protein